MALPARNGRYWPRWSATEGLKQSELAEQMEMQPITLTRLIDRLCDNGWIERRSDDADRRVNRLYLRKAARPLLGKLSGLRSELTATALDGITQAMPIGFSPSWN